MDTFYPTAIGPNVRPVTFDKPGARMCWLDGRAARRSGELPASMRQPTQWNSKVQGSFKWTWFQGSKARLPPQWRFAMPESTDMKDHVYKILELVGSSEKSIEDATQNAVTRASKTIRDMKWFEVVQTRGHIENGSVRHYQVTLRVGFTLER
jgi:flavin-binding protein dodecin